MKKEDVIQAIIEFKETCSKHDNCLDCDFYDCTDNSDVCLIKNTDELPRNWIINKHVDKDSASYRQIKIFIRMNRYNWSVEEVLGEYEGYCNGSYVGETMKNIIENNETAIKLLLGVEK